MTWTASRWFAAVACLLSGALFLASLDIGPFGPLVLIAPVAVLVTALSAPRWQAVAAVAFVARLIGAIGLIWAYHDVLPPAALVFWILVQAAFFTLIVLATRWIARSAPVWATLLAFPLLSTAVEFLFGQVSPHGSFGAVGAALVDVLPLLQLASLGGLPALTFCAGLFAMTCALAIANPPAWRMLVVLGAAPILLALAFGFWRMSEPYEVQKRIALLAIDPISGRAAPDADPAVVVQAYTAALRGIEGGADFVLLPEAVFKTSPASRAAIETPFHDAANQMGAPLVAGFDEALGDGQKANTALLFTPGAASPQRYIKRRLIPGLDVDYVTGSSAFVDGTTGIAICKDLDFPAMIREYGQRGVTLMLAPSWDFGTDGRLHARMAVVRGVENGFALARAATDGRLTVSDRTGRIVAEAVTQIDAPTVLTGEVGLRSGGTLYTRIGDLFGWIVVIAAVALVGFRLLTRAQPAHDVLATSRSRG